MLLTETAKMARMQFAHVNIITRSLREANLIPIIIYEYSLSLHSNLNTKALDAKSSSRSLSYSVTAYDEVLVQKSSFSEILITCKILHPGNSRDGPALFSYRVEWKSRGCVPLKICG